MRLATTSQDMASLKALPTKKERLHMPPLSLAKFHKACCFVCYRCYVFTGSNWCPGMCCIRIPACVEANIWMTLPGDGIFIGFQHNNND